MPLLLRKGLNLIGGRWKLLILTQLKKGALRFGELKNRIPQVTERMLTLQLREMEAEGIVQRTVYPEAPPKVEYALTTISERLLLICHQLSAWGTEHRQAPPGTRVRRFTLPPFSRRWPCATLAQISVLTLSPYPDD
ncbi:MAG: helix-turn-helix domain-containing protein [Hymenobacter sp.]